MQNENIPTNNEQENVSQSALPNPAPESVQITHKKPKKKILLILLILICLTALATAVYLFMKPKQQTVQNQSQSEEQVKIVKSSGTLIYATRLNEVTSVQVKDLTKNQATEEFNFKEKKALDIDSLNANEAWSAGGYYAPPIDLNDSGTEFVYINNNNLIIRNKKTKQQTTLIKNTSQTNSNSEIQTITLNPAPPKVSGPGLSVIANPVWSRDGKYIGLELGYYEGGAIQVINKSSKKYIGLGDTFRYISELGVPVSRFSLLNQNAQLASLGIFGEYLVNEYNPLLSPAVTLDSKNLLAILCPLNLPNSGDATYDPSAFSAKDQSEMKRIRDCGEKGDKILISINLTNGTYKEIAKGEFEHTYGVNSIALQSKDIIYVGGNKESSYKITKLSLANPKSTKLLDIKALGEISSSDKILGTIVKNVGTTPVLEIYFTRNNNQYVEIVNLSSEKLLTIIPLQAKMTYTTLGVN